MLIRSRGHDHYSTTASCSISPPRPAPEVVLSGLSPRQAHARAAGENADDEPFLLDGIVLVARAGCAGTEVRLTVSDEKSVPELRRRAAAIFARVRADETG